MPISIVLQQQDQEEVAEEIVEEVAEDPPRGEDPVPEVEVEVGGAHFHSVYFSLQALPCFEPSNALAPCIRA